MAHRGEKAASEGRTRRGAGWYLKRGAGLWASGFALLALGGWAGWLWLQVPAFVTGVIGLMMVMTGAADLQRARRKAWWQWFRAEYEKNERRARAPTDDASGESAPPPNDRSS